MLMELARTQYTAAGLDDLASIRQFVQTTASAFCQDTEAIADLILAFNEAVTNIIIHGYQQQPGTIEIVVKGDDQRLLIQVRDQAPLFDPTSMASPDITLPLGQRPRGGMGIHMMRQFVDRLYYRMILSGGNELGLEKEIKHVTTL